MTAAARDGQALAIISRRRIEFHQTPPSGLPETMDEFRALVPVITDHFGDAIGPSPTLTNGNNDQPELEWRTSAVRLLDAIGARPSSEMLGCMVAVARWPEASRTQAAVGRAESAGALGGRRALIRAIKEDSRTTATAVLPALCHLNPMPPEAIAALTSRIENAEETDEAVVAIRSLGANRALPSSLVDALAARARDSHAPITVRVAAIYSLAAAAPTALNRLAGLERSASPDVADAARNVGIGLTSDRSVDMP